MSLPRDPTHQMLARLDVQTALARIILAAGELECAASWLPAPEVIEALERIGAAWEATAAALRALQSADLSATAERAA